MVSSSGSITIEIGPPGPVKQFCLTGTVGNQIQVGFRAKEGYPEVPLGSFESIIDSVASVLGAGEEFAADFRAKLDDLNTIPVLGEVVNQLRNANLFVTDLAISAEYDADTDAYVVSSAAFGFRVEFDSLSLGPVKIRGFGVLFEYSPSQGEGELTTIPG